MEEAAKLKAKKMKDMIDKRMNNTKAKYGKIDMQRSKKPKVKQEVVKKVIDEETMD